MSTPFSKTPSKIPRPSSAMPFETPKRTKQKGFSSKIPLYKRKMSSVYSCSMSTGSTKTTPQIRNTSASSNDSGVGIEDDEMDKVKNPSSESFTSIDLNDSSAIKSTPNQVTVQVILILLLQFFFVFSKFVEKYISYGHLLTLVLYSFFELLQR